MEAEALRRPPSKQKRKKFGLPFRILARQKKSIHPNVIVIKRSLHFFSQTHVVNLLPETTDEQFEALTGIDGFEQLLLQILILA